MFTDLEFMGTNNEDVSLIRKMIKEKSLKCANIVDVKGDTRFWNVCPESHPIFREFKQLANETVKNELGKDFEHVILMVNHITPETSPEGSGGGWHVDSVQNQYKLFMYVTDCESIDKGPLTLLSTGNKLKDRIQIILNYLKGNKFRFSNKDAKKLEKKGFAQIPILRPCLKPFFVNTSFIHRGAEIRTGERMLITAYMFDNIPQSIQKRILP